MFLPFVEKKGNIILLNLVCKLDFGPKHVAIRFHHMYSLENLGLKNRSHHLPRSIYQSEARVIDVLNFALFTHFALCML